MIATDHCLDEARLNRLASGLLSEAEEDQARQHLTVCPACVAAHDQLLAPLAEAFRQYAPLPADPDQSTIDCLIKTMASLAESRPETPPSRAGEETLVTVRLSPPESRDEIGRLGGYRVLGVLGEGGMGQVLRAENLLSKQSAAIKVIRPDRANSAALRERFLREARSASALDHDHIVPVWHAGEQDGVLFIVMPLLKGETLAERLKREPRLPLNLVLQIGRETASALAAAHAKGLIHRDIKPANLWLEERGDGVRVRVLDFGLARVVREAVGPTLIGTLLGTPQYMAPEQARGEAVDERADLFSLGCVLYQALTGMRPFDGPSVLAVLSALENRLPIAPHELNANEPRDLSDLTMQLLEKERDRRPTSAARVVEILGKPAGSPKRPQRRILLALSAAGLAAGLAAVVLGGVVVIVKGVRIEVQDGWTVVVDKDGNVLLRAPGAKAPEATGVQPKPEQDKVRQAEEIHRFSWQNSGAIALAFSPDGKQVLSGDREGKTLIWGVADGTVHGSLGEIQKRVLALAYSPDGHQAFVARQDGLVRQYDTVTSREIRQLMGIVSQLAYSPRGDRLATGGGRKNDNQVRIWDISTGKEQHKINCDSEVIGLAWAKEGKVLLAGTACEGPFYCDARTGEKQAISGLLLLPLNRIAFSPDGLKAVASSREDPSILLIDLEKPTVLRRHKIEGAGTGGCVAFAPDGKSYAASFLQGPSRMWDLPSGAELCQFGAP